MFKRSLILSFLLLSRVAFAFPDTECLGTDDTNPPFDFGFSNTVTGFALKDDRTMFASYGDVLAIVDLGYFDLAEDQPPPLSVDADTDGRLAAIVYSADNNRVYATQEDGDCLIYDLAHITEDPTSITIVEDNELGPIAVDNNGLLAYIINTKDNSVNTLNLSSLTIDSTFTLTIPTITTFTVTAAVHDSETNDIYFTTDKGVVFYMAAGSSAATIITTDPTYAANLSSIAVTPNGAYAYVTDKTNNNLIKIDASTYAIIKTISLAENPAPTGIVITSVTRPQGGSGNAVYAYVAGSKGVSVVNTATDEVLDMGDDPHTNHEPIPMSETPTRVVASSDDDGFVYTANATQTVSVISANPWVTITSLTYSGGGDKMGKGESFTIKFKSDIKGTATIMAGGDVDASGKALKDDAGKTSWDIPTVDTDVTVTIPYDANASSFIEGANVIFVFVTASTDDRGRIATTVNVDTPPPDVVILSSGFGNERIYVTFNRIDVADMNHYNIYIDTDPAEVLIKTTPDAKPKQAASGSTQTAYAGNLMNGTLYYIAMEAVDDAGNISPRRTNKFADGTVATGMPQKTAGPCGFSGEKGCSLLPDSSDNEKNFIFYIAAIVTIILFLLSWRLLRFALHRTVQGFARNDKVFFIILFLAILLFPKPTLAKEPSPQWWSVEAKTGFWIPKNYNVNHFFGDCCNLVTRIQGGLLVQGRYGVEEGVGIFFKDAYAAGTTTRQTSGDKFSFILIPMETNLVWRVDYWKWDYVLPYIKAGFDYWFFRENVQGHVTKGIKLGMHGVLGAQINLEVIDEATIKGMDDDFGINDLFLTLEAQYQYINNFGKHGLNLTGPVFSIGFLFEF